MDILPTIAHMADVDLPEEHVVDEKNIFDFFQIQKAQNLLLHILVIILWIKSRLLESVTRNYICRLIGV